MERDSSPRPGDGVRAEFLGRTEAYDAAILDLGLPRMDGLTLLRRWREAGVATPVLVLTARASWHEKVLGINFWSDRTPARQPNWPPTTHRSSRPRRRPASGRLDHQKPRVPVALVREHGHTLTTRSNRRSYARGHLHDRRRRVSRSGGAGLCAS